MLRKQRQGGDGTPVLAEQIGQPGEAHGEVNGAQERSTQPGQGPRASRKVLNGPEWHEPAAVVVGLDSMQGLQAARILQRRGVPVIGIAANRRSPLAHTNACRKIIIAPTHDERLIEHLLDLGPRLGQKAVLFPSEDNSVQLVSRNRQLLAPYYHVLLPSEEVVETLMDKVRFAIFAQQHGLPIPTTWIVEDERDLEVASREANYPCLLKPRSSSADRWECRTMHKAFKVHSPEQLASVYRQCRAWTDCVLVQEWIDGSDADLYSCNCYFDAQGEPLVTFVAKKIRQWPPETGISSLGEECRNDTVLNETIRLFRLVRYHGLGYLEMKQDRRSGRYLIVEPNIGRPTGRSAIAEAGGVELLYTAYCDALQRPLPANRQQQYRGVKWVHLRKDLQSAFCYWRRGELTLRQWRRSLRGKKAYALASWRDPWPFLGDLGSAFLSAFSPRKRKARSLPPS